MPAGIASNFTQLWNVFAAEKSIAGAGLKGEAPRYGALSAGVALRAGETKAVTFILVWYLPNRPFLTSNPGNYYATLYRNAEDVADKVAGWLGTAWRTMLEWQQLMRDNSLPDWLQDSLINSIASMYKTGMRFRDGRWRQWESFACADMDPGHIDFYEVLPYVFFYPELRKQILSRFATIQRSDGFIPEVLTTGGVPKSVIGATGPLDQAGGRDMGDSATIFVQGWQYYLWTGDRAFLDSMWPHVRSATLWQIERNKAYGLPQHLQTTYDLFHFDQKTLVSYNGFLHLASLLAGDKMAEVRKDPASSISFRVAKRLSFNPANSAPPRLPFFTPQASGVIEAAAPDKWRVKVTTGHLAIHEIQIANFRWKGDKTLSPGDSLDLSSTSMGNGESAAAPI